ncbi:flagellar hook protein FlgE [Ectothiorhodospira haloalkaliphila]|uniref:flagellar hook protein FlgE n=1 Tax=Ectothiorhodospira haloalkaliphila TaxID=421628 RepID=UPI001EE887D3|nr:flagellar hook protein FlgE [Ectothiorhodospira haloalkaliphila]MCG5524500.1 flagellar hook protein FlgE [Ectothiorhodospira haloalkaliphila]
MPSFNIGLTGINAASKDLEVTGHNISNSSTAGFKGSRAEFADVFALSYTGVSRLATGSGVSLADVSQQFNQGDLEFTDNNLDLALNGRGFFIVEREGIREYTRAGQFLADKDGFIVNSAGQRLQGYGTEGGNILGDIRLTTGDAEPQSTTGIEALMNLSAAAPSIPPEGDPGDVPFDPDDPETYNESTSLTVYDSLGAEHTLSLFFQRNPPPSDKSWDVFATFDGELIDFDDSSLTFNTDGTLASAGGVDGGRSLTLPFGDDLLPNGALIGDENNEITIDFSETSQFGDRFSVSRLNQDGFAPGQLIDVDVENDGTVFARFTNGVNRVLGNVALANFDNPQGLQPVGGTNWVETTASGEPLLGRPGDSGFGLVQGGAFENSNVNIAEQLVNLITAQRNFQANAQVISTADTITQTIINLR